MKKTILTRILALIGAVIAVVTMAIVPTFAYEKTADFNKSDYSKYSNVFMEGVEYRLRTSSDYTNGFAMTFSAENGVAYHRRLVEYDITYQVPETSSNYIYLRFDTFADRSGPDPYVDYRCKKLRIRTYYGFDEEVGYDRGLQIYLDDELFLGFHYLGAHGNEPYDDGRCYDSFAVSCCDVDISGDWTAVNPFDLSIFVCEAWMTNFSCPYPENYPDCVWDFFETYDVINHKDYLGRYQSGYDDGYSDCEFDNRDMWYEEGLNTGLENGWNNGYQGGYDVGYDVGYTEGQAYGESLHADDWQYGYDIGYAVGVGDGMLAYDSYYDDYWSSYYNSDVYASHVHNLIQSNDSNPVAAFFNSIWNGILDAYMTVTSGISVGGISLGNVIVTLVIAAVVIFVVKMVI